MTCCIPKFCICPIKINDTSRKAPTFQHAPLPTDMCVTYILNHFTEQMEPRLVPCLQIEGHNEV